MQLGIVQGSVTSTVKHAVLEQEKLLLVQPVNPDLSKTGSTILGLDRVQAGKGDLVLFVEEGNSARTILGDSMAPVKTVILAIVDKINI